MMPSSGSIRMSRRAGKRGSLGAGLRASSVRGVRRHSIVRSVGVNCCNADSADQLNAERIRDPAGNLVSQLEQVGCVAVEAFRPEMRIALGVDQLGIDPYLVRRSADAAFHHIANTEFATDLPGVDRLAFIGES